MEIIKHCKCCGNQFIAQDEFAALISFLSFVTFASSQPAMIMRRNTIIKMFVKRFISILQKWGQPILELPPNIIFRIYRIFNPLT